MTPDSDRVGIRLDGAPLPRTRHEELPSEACVPGSLQIPPSGLPILFHAVGNLAALHLQLLAGHLWPVDISSFRLVLS